MQHTTKDKRTCKVKLNIAASLGAVVEEFSKVSKETLFVYPGDSEVDVGALTNLTPVDWSGGASVGSKAMDNESVGLKESRFRAGRSVGDGQTMDGGVDMVVFQKPRSPRRLPKIQPAESTYVVSQPDSPDNRIRPTSLIAA